MADVFRDRVQETSTTTGTGNFTLAGAVDRYQRFSAVCSNGDTFGYFIEGAPGTGEWETGYGTYSATDTLVRTDVVDSSNGGAAVSFSAGTKHVGMTLLGTMAENFAAGSGGGWSIIDSWIYSTPVSQAVLTGLDAATELIVYIKQVTTSTSGRRTIQLSTDGGATFYSNAADYVLINGSGAESNSIGKIDPHDTDSGAARTTINYIKGNIAGVDKIIEQKVRISQSIHVFRGSTAVIDALRVYPSNGGNLTGGSIYIYGR